MKKLLKVTIISIICTMLQACNSGLVVEKSTVSATVTNTEYKASYTLYYPRWDFNQKRATIARQFVPSEYLVIQCGKYEMLLSSLKLNEVSYPFK